MREFMIAAFIYGFWYGVVVIETMPSSDEDVVAVYVGE